MEIRRLEFREVEQIVDIWYEASVRAHDFISSVYWEENKEIMAIKYIPESETYIVTENNTIEGFVSMVDNYLAAIFVKPDRQRLGFGKALLGYVKGKRSEILLKVYKKNSGSVRFYLSQGFKELKEEVDSGTGEIEIVMEWRI